jgi:hypothetical protein
VLHTKLCFDTDQRRSFSLRRSHQDLAHEIDDLGAIPTANSSREQLLMSVDVLRNSLPQSMDLLADTVMNPKLGGWGLIMMMMIVMMMMRRRRRRRRTRTRTRSIMTLLVLMIAIDHDPDDPDDPDLMRAQTRGSWTRRSS